ncbi:hypothetical protein BDZ89DRAFT_1164424 [Hymenopellis radicata]|nr:hypothetical protein BDZ89DRAFT_1164424 [Hymenopellis radicata]
MAQCCSAHSCCHSTRRRCLAHVVLCDADLCTLSCAHCPTSTVCLLRVFLCLRTRSLTIIEDQDHNARGRQCRRPMATSPFDAALSVHIDFD